MSNEISTIQNISLTLNKIVTSKMAIEFDKDQNKNTLNLLVLVL